MLLKWRPNATPWLVLVAMACLLIGAPSVPPDEDSIMHEMRNDLHIEYLPIDQIKPYSRKLRQHGQAQLAKASKLIERYGQVLPILVSKDTLEIIDGHLVLEAMRRGGHSQVAVVIAANRDPAEIRALRLALNRLADETVWNKPELALEFRELLELDYDMELTGFDEVEIEAILSIGNDIPLPEANPLEGVDPDSPTVSRLGDLWILGEHRVFCGNSVEKSSFVSVMNDEKARLVLSDPPYNVKIQGHVGGSGSIKHPEFAMASGEMTEDEFTQFLTTAFQHLAAFSLDGSLMYAFMDWRHMGEILTAGRSVYSELKCLCVWNKTNGGMGSLYRSKHELVFVFKNGKGQHINNVALGKHGRNRTNVWDYPGVNTLRSDRMDELSMHPTVKPVAMLADAILDVSHKGDIVLDGFGGAGSTLMAAEQTERRARLIEISPLYVDVTIRRWQEATGGKAIHAETGQPFDEFQPGEGRD